MIHFLTTLCFLLMAGFSARAEVTLTTVSIRIWALLYESPANWTIPARVFSRNEVASTLTFDAHLNLTGVTLSDNSAALSYTYDEWDRRITAKDSAYSSAPHTFAYDLASRVTSIDGPWTDDTVSYAYDDALRRVTRTTPGGVADTITADSFGRVSSVVNPLGTYTYQYGPQASDPLAAITHSGGFDRQFTYHGSEQDRALATMTSLLPGGGLISRHSYQYDTQGRISSWQRESILTDPAAGQRSFQWQAAYDASSRLSGVAENSLSGAFSASWDYRYDAADNLSRIQKTLAATPPALTVDRRSHNHLNQITTADGTGPATVRGTLGEPGTATVGLVGGTMKPARMLAGNRFEAELDLADGSNDFRVNATDDSGNTSSYTYRISKTTAAARSFTYDTAGNLLSDGNRSYTWDGFNRLTAVNWGGGKTTEFRYNALGQRCERVHKQSGTVVSTERLLFDGISPVCRYTGGTAASNIDRRYYEGGEQRLESGNWTGYFYARDHLGSVREVVKSDSTLAARYDFDPYGKRNTAYQATSYIGGCDFGFTGHVTLESGVSGQAELVLTHFRAYDPELGRWLSADPLGEEGGMNLYGYVGGNPMMFVDPLGLDFWTWGDSDNDDWFPSAGQIAESVTTFGAGLSDNATFGATSGIRGLYAGNNNVDKCSNSYQGGEWAGIATGLLMGGKSSVQLAGKINALKGGRTARSALDTMKGVNLSEGYVRQLVRRGLNMGDNVDVGHLVSAARRGGGTWRNSVFNLVEQDRKYNRLAGRLKGNTGKGMKGFIKRSLGHGMEKGYAAARIGGAAVPFSAAGALGGKLNECE